MPRVKNVDCVACKQRITYEYAIHRKTVLHKLNSARYNANGSMIYFDSVDLDKSGERVTVQLLRNQNKEADIICKKLKAEKRLKNKKTKKDITKKVNIQHQNFEKKRKIAANCNRHLLPKTKPNILQRKLAYEAEMVYQEQMASIKHLPNYKLLQNYDEDLHHFNLNPTTSKSKSTAIFNKHSTDTFTSNISSQRKKLSKSIKPLANSTQLHYTQSSHTSGFTDEIFTNAAVENILNNFSQTNTIHYHSIQTNNTLDNITDTDTEMTTTDNIMHTSIINTSIQNKYYNISQIPLPETNQTGINNNIQTRSTDINIYNCTATENLSFFTSFYTLPAISNPTITNPIRNHIHHISSPMSPNCDVLPAKPLQQSFLLQPLDLHSFDENTNPRCRRCFANINFRNLFTLSDRMPKGRQIFCAACLLLITSRSKAKNVDYFNS